MKRVFLAKFLILISYVLFSQQQDILKIRESYLKGELVDTKQIEDLKLEHPQEVIKHLILFEIYIDKKNIEEAYKYYSYLQSFYPINQLVNYRMAEYYLSKGNLEEAKNYLQLCVRNDSRFHEARYLLAKTFYQLKDYQQAFKHYNVLSWFKPEIQEHYDNALMYVNNALVGVCNFYQIVGIIDVIYAILTIMVVVKLDTNMKKLELGVNVSAGESEEKFG